MLFMVEVVCRDRVVEGPISFSHRATPDGWFSRAGRWKTGSYFHFIFLFHFFISFFHFITERDLYNRTESVERRPKERIQVKDMPVLVCCSFLPPSRVYHAISMLWVRFFPFFSPSLLPFCHRISFFSVFAIGYAKEAESRLQTKRGP